jgi:hypothetical protein
LTAAIASATMSFRECGTLVICLFRS